MATRRSDVELGSRSRSKSRSSGSSTVIAILPSWFVTRWLCLSETGSERSNCVRECFPAEVLVCSVVVDDGEPDDSSNRRGERWMRSEARWWKEGRGGRVRRVEEAVAGVADSEESDVCVGSLGFRDV